MVELLLLFSCSVLSDSLRSHRLPHAWLPSLSNTSSQSLLKLMPIKSVMPSNHLMLGRPLLLLSIFPSIRVFSKESVLCIRWPKYWSFSFSISSFNEYSGLISFRIDWLALLAVQGTLKSLLHSSKASILRHSAFFTNSRSLLKLMSIELVMPSSHLILCHPLLLLPSIFSSIRVFSNESVLHIRWPEYWSFSFSISPSNELIFFRIDWFDLLAVQGTLKSLLQHHSSKASILRHSAFFIVQLSHPYMTTGKTIALTRQTFVGKIMSLLFIMLSRLVIAFSYNL